MRSHACLCGSAELLFEEQKIQDELVSIIDIAKDGI